MDDNLILVSFLLMMIARMQRETAIESRFEVIDYVRFRLRPEHHSHRVGKDSRTRLDWVALEARVFERDAKKEVCHAAPYFNDRVAV